MVEIGLLENEVEGDALITVASSDVKNGLRASDRDVNDTYLLSPVRVDSLIHRTSLESFSNVQFFMSFT